MTTADMLRWARAQAGLTQAELARRSGVPQPNISRIERGDVSPRVETFERLLAECGFELALEPKKGRGVDRTAIRERLAMSPRERIEATVAAAASLGELTDGV